MNSLFRLTYSFQCDLFLLFLCCVADWMSRESGVKGLKFTQGVWFLLTPPLSTTAAFFAVSKLLLNRATLLLEPPALPLALDSKLWKGREVRQVRME